MIHGSTQGSSAKRLRKAGKAWIYAEENTERWIEGERKTEAKLDEFDYHYDNIDIFHDIRFGNGEANIDHLVLDASGKIIFIDSKNLRKGNLEKYRSDIFEKLKKQRKYLEERLKTHEIEGIAVVYEDYISNWIEAWNEDGYSIVRGNYLGTYLKNHTSEAMGFKKRDNLLRQLELMRFKE